MNIAQMQAYIIAHEKVDIIKDLAIHEYNEVVHYYPEELTLTVQAGALVGNIRKLLQEQGQDFDFTAGDHEMIGSVFVKGGHDIRMSILGVEIIDGRGDVLTFGGEVIKNVAGYDVSRMLCGSRGKCGVITQMSFKVLPINALSVHTSEVPRTHEPEPEYTQHITQGIYQVFDPLAKFS